MQQHPPLPPRIIGDKPLGVTKKVTAQIVRTLRRQLSEHGRAVAVRAIRFIPSSRSATETGSFQVVANAVVELAARTDAPHRLESFDSVVTVGRSGGVQTLEGLSIPALHHDAL